MYKKTSDVLRMAVQIHQTAGKLKVIFTGCALFGALPGPRYGFSSVAPGAHAPNGHIPFPGRVRRRCAPDSASAFSQASRLEGVVAADAIA